MLCLPRLEEGDLVAVHSSGAYGLTASPIHFISHPPPFEVLVDRVSMVDVTRSPSGLSPSPGGSPHSFRATDVGEDRRRTAP